MEVCYRKDEDLTAAYLINHAKGEAVGLAASNIIVDRPPSERVLLDSLNGGSHFGTKFLPKAGALPIVPADGFAHFGLRGSVIADSHRSSESEKNSFSDTSGSSPDSNAATR